MSFPRIAAASLAAAAVLCAFQGRMADAQDAETTERALFFSGADLSGTSAFLFGGFIWAPEGINAAGFAMKTLFGGGFYRYRSGAQEIVGRQVVDSIMPGWRFKREKFEASMFAGLDMQNHRFHPLDPGNRLAGEHFGLRIAGDAWWEPSPDTMATGWASWSTTGANYSARAAYGWRPAGLFYFGPEAQVMGDGSYSELRFGIHATAWRSGPLEWSAGGGYAHSRSSDGANVRLGVLARQ